MGDRAVYGFRDGAGGPTLYLYSHWGGDEQDKTLAEALRAAEPRWDDPAYATRIATSYIIGNAWDKETGYGLSIGNYAMPDYDYINVVTWADKMVRRYALDDDGELGKVESMEHFDTYIAQNL